MLKIYGVYRSRASRNIWLAMEMGIPFEHVPIMQAYRLPDPSAPGAPVHTRSPQFLKVNPNGHIPSIDDDGFVMHESLAINLYLARKYGGPMAPATLQEEGLAAMWSLWAATEVEPHSINVLYHMVGKPPAERDANVAAAAVEALQAPFAVLDKTVAGSGYVMGDRFTVADINVAEVVRYALPAKDLIEANSNLKAWITRCHARPAFKAMMARREEEPA